MWRRLLPWGVVLLLGVILVVRTDLKSIAASMRSIHWVAYVAFVLTFSIVNLLFDAIATWKTYQQLTSLVDFRSIFMVRAASYLSGIINYHAGQAYLTYLLSKKYAIPIGRVIGGTLVVYATTLGNFILLAALSLPFAAQQASWVPRVVAFLALGVLVYFGLLQSKPKFLTRFAIFAPLFEVGVLGHLRLMLWRLPHIAVLSVSLWLAYWFFGVVIPPQASLSDLPIILLVSALPITPQGAGTRELIAIELLSSFVPASAAGDRTAPIIAAGAAFVVVATLGQALIGCAYLRPVGRLLRPMTFNPTAES